ncbi:MAG TPA: hypothetical protein VNM48_16685 [Chloroflexota bacterium]|nr:hypothetical protein [Chloroflexota bacterium]
MREPTSGETVYNLGVDEDNSYFAGGIAVHNCDDLAGNRRYGRPGFYPTGKEPTKPHPQCQCAALPVHEEADDFTDRLLAWIVDPGQQPDLEQWYAATASPLLDRPMARRERTAA